MPRLNLTSLSLIGILLIAAAQASAQDESHVLTQESAADVQPVDTPPAVMQERGGGGGRANPNPPGRAGRASAPRPGARDPGNGRVVVAPPVVYNGHPRRYAYSGRYLPSRPIVYGSGYLYYGPGFGYFGPGFGVYYGN